MNQFTFQGKELYCEGTSIRKIADEVGTPCYLYSLTSLQDNYRAFESAFAQIPHLISFAVKANSNLAILRIIAKEGGGADIVSGGELYRALAAGIDPQKIVFAGVGKTAEEILYALKTDILMFNVESSQELLQINSIARELKLKARVALRVNPNIDPKTHPYISTGLKKNKFGIGIDRALMEYQQAAKLDHIEIVGIHQHIGSQLTEVQPYVDALKRVLALVAELKQSGINLRYINVGGGLGITYDDEDPPHPTDLAQALSPLIRDLKCTLLLEPGRSIVGNAGVLITKVLYTKESEKKRFVIVDAGMNDLIRPSLYSAYHKIQHVFQNQRKKVAVDVVGPICESADFFAKDRELEECQPGDLLAVMSAGAYGFSMASNYNSRPLVAEVMIKRDQYAVIREREDYRDLIKGEKFPDFLS
jgi:diaminopimelate decarboxylase